MHPESEQRAAGRLGSLLLLFERGGQENGALTQRESGIAFLLDTFRDVLGLEQ